MVANDLNIHLENILESVDSGRDQVSINWQLTQMRELLISDEFPNLSRLEMQPVPELINQVKSKLADVGMHSSVRKLEKAEELLNLKLLELV
jgi:hypothetical protein